PLKEWVKDEDDTWLEELLRAEGRGDHRSYSVCPRCKIQTDEFIAVPMYRCEDCLSGGEMLCQGCMVSTHSQSPLHHIEV
ncbi:hypothetical protein B0H16DRAFT_1243865, partial [Mycena metata]